MTCINSYGVEGCYQLPDGGRQTVIIHNVTDDSGAVVATLYLDAEHNPVEGATPENVSVGACLTNEFCVESQEWTYGIDNTGTNYRWPSACYRLILSDGSTIEWEQTTAANGGWTPQMEEWGTNIQAAADAAGIKWFVETRFRDPANPANLAGAGGFPGPPTLAVSNALTSMLWRYVNIQICPGQPVPVSAEVVEVKDAGGTATREPGYPLTTDGAVLGPIQKFWLCKDCAEEPVWYLEDGVTPAEAGQIPNCWEPCGTLALTESPPDRECQTFIADGCDNVEQTDPNQFEQSIQRHTKVCGGEITSVEYFQPDPGDATALVAYSLIGLFVDCASGAPIEEELPPCNDTSYVGLLWQLGGEAEVGTNVDYWAPTTTALNGNAAPHGNVSDIFTSDDRTLQHVNGAPDVTYVSPTFDMGATSQAAFLANVGAASNADTNGTDQIRLRGYIILDRPGLLKDTNPNTGERGGVWINPCCSGTLDLYQERTTDTVSGDTGVFDGVLLPEGIHYVEAVTSDLSAWQGLQLSVSFDDGASFIPMTSYLTKPSYTCLPVVRCNDSGVLLNAETGELITVGENDRWCEPKCVTPEGDAEAGAAGPTAQEIADAMVIAERNSVEGCIEKFQGNATQQLSVPAGTRGNLISVSDTGTGLVYFTLDGSAPGNTPTGPNRGELSGPYLAAPIRNIDLSQVRFDGSSGASDYTVYYEKFI